MDSSTTIERFRHQLISVAVVPGMDVARVVQPVDEYGQEGEGFDLDAASRLADVLACDIEIRVQPRGGLCPNEAAHLTLDGII